MLKLVRFLRKKSILILWIKNKYKHIKNLIYDKI
jgi:hypothetical protein